MRFSLGPRPPKSVAAVALEPGERRLAWAVTAGGAAVLATDVGLRLPGADRLAWPDIERVSWDRPTLVVLGIAPVEGTGERRQVELVGDCDLPAVVRSQVMASIGWSMHYRLRPTLASPGGPEAAGGVRIVGRRRPGREVLDWQVVYDRDTAAPDPQQRAQAEALLLDARRTIG